MANSLPQPPQPEAGENGEAAVQAWTQVDSSYCVEIGQRPAKSQRLSSFGCFCCGPRLAGHEWIQLQISEQTPLDLASAAAAADGCRAVPYVDTHCHLDLVLKLHRRLTSVPSTRKPWRKMESEEVRLWRLLGWTSEQWHARDIKGNPIWSRPWARLSPTEIWAASALGWDADKWNSKHWPLPNLEWADLPDDQRCHLVVLGESADSWPHNLKKRKRQWGIKRDKGNPVWYQPWMQLTSAQSEAAKALGWDANKWDGKWWLLPYEEWSELREEVRSHLAVLGETAESWAVILQSKVHQQGVSEVVQVNPIWQRPWAELTASQQDAASALGWNAAQWSSNAWLLPNVDWPELDEDVRRHLVVLGESETSWPANLVPGSARKGAGYGGDWRLWIDLSQKEREAATKLGFTGPVWDMAEMSDLHSFVGEFVGSGFEGCVAQGVDADSIDDTVQLVSAHPLVFASFGCHPKTAWEYDEAFESRLLNAFSACGKKAVAWGECGLDYSSLHWGCKHEYRQKQREVFRRQIELAIERGLPLVLHVRDASHDALEDIRHCVPKHWKAHLHSFLGETTVIDALLAEYPNMYVGLTGTVTMGGGGEQVCCSVPLSRVLLETDSPCIVPRAVPFSHAGQIPLIARTVASLNGWDLKDLFLKARENTRFLYGI